MACCITAMATIYCTALYGIMHWIICTCTVCKCSRFLLEISIWDLCPTIPPNTQLVPFIGYYLYNYYIVGRKPKKFTMEFSKTNEYTKFLQTHVFYYDLYDQSDEFNVIGQQVSYCRRPRAIYGMLHSGWAITNTYCKEIA